MFMLKRATASEVNRVRSSAGAEVDKKQFLVLRLVMENQTEKMKKNQKEFQKKVILKKF